jgi:hypothetical protein
MTRRCVVCGIEMVNVRNAWICSQLCRDERRRESKSVYREKEKAKRREQRRTVCRIPNLGRRLENDRNRIKEKAIIRAFYKLGFADDFEVFDCDQGTLDKAIVRAFHELGFADDIEVT